MAEQKVKKEPKKAAAKPKVEKPKAEEQPKQKKMTQAQLAAYYEQLKQEAARRDDEYWLKYYVKIINKNGEQVPFVLNPIQKKIEDKIKELESQGKPARIIVLKARQEGVSTYTQAKFLCRTIKNKNRNALVVAHRDDSTNAIFDKAKYCNSCLPDHIKPLQRASNARELIFDTPVTYKGKEKGLNSKIKVQTAGSDGIGRSDTYHYIHLSEFAFYSGDPLKALSGINSSVPSVVGTIVILESTANGNNSFKTLWDLAEAGENDYTPMFFSWFDYPDYQMPVTDEERIEIMSSLNEYEEYLVNTHELSAERIKWYRWKLKNDCNGDVDLMKQENPSNSHEAFLATGRPVFDNARVERRIEQLKKEYKLKPPRRGFFIFNWNDPDSKDKIIDSSIKFVDSPNGYIYIYEEPKNGYPFVLGGDTALGGLDFFSGTGINNATGKRVVTLHGKMAIDTYSHQMYCLGKYYNNALISIEVNADLFPVAELDRLKYHNQYKRESIDEIYHKKLYKHGFKTDGNTRPYIISLEIVLIRDNIELFTHIDMLSECLTFVIDKNGRPDAESGKHDDILMSDMIANASRSQQRFTVERNAQFELPPNMSEEEKARVKANIEFSDKYVEMAKYRRKK